MEWEHYRGRRGDFVRGEFVAWSPQVQALTARPRFGGRVYRVERKEEATEMIACYECSSHFERDPENTVDSVFSFCRDCAQPAEPDAELGGGD